MVVLHPVNHPKVTDRRSGDYNTHYKRTSSYPALAHGQSFPLMETTDHVPVRGSYPCTYRAFRSHRYVCS